MVAYLLRHIKLLQKPPSPCPAHFPTGLGEPECPQPWNHTFSKFNSVFFGNRRKLPKKKPVVKSPQFRLCLLIFLLKSSLRAFPRLYSHQGSVLPWSNTIPLKNLNYLQAKVGGAQTHKFPPIPQIGGFPGISYGLFESLPDCEKLFAPI